MTVIKTSKENFKLVPTEKLIPHPRNNNRHSIEQLERLAKIIEHRGFREPLTVSKRSGFVVCGHARLEAAKILGMEELPVIEQDFESEAEEYGHLTADNEIARWAQLDLHDIYNAVDEFDLSQADIDLLGIENFSIPEVENIPECDEDHVPEVKPDPITKRGDVWLLGGHRVMCGDSTMIDDVENLMNGEKADMVFTDPPYGVDYDGGHAEKGVRREKLKNDSTPDIYNEVLPVCNMFSNDNSPLYLWYSDSKSLAVLSAVLSAGYEVRTNIIWNKNVAQFGAIGAQYKTKHEPCLYCYKKGHNTSWDGPNNEVSVWDVDRHHKNEFHPTQKPTALAERAIGNHKAGAVLDVFLGSGSTLIACEKTSRKCYGMELDEKYCDVIVNRWQEYTGKKATLESTGEKFDDISVR